MSNSSKTPSPLSSSRDSHDSHLWDVQEILAERTSITGENELLVVWKTSWIPCSNMIADGPVMTRFRDSPKWNFSSAAGAMCIKLPVEPGTILAQDCAMVVAAADSARGAKEPLSCASPEALGTAETLTWETKHKRKRENTGN